MLTGTVDVRATITGHGLTFPVCEFTPNEAGIDKVAIEAPAGDEIRITVHFAAVASADAATASALALSTGALNRLGFHYDIVITNARALGHQLSPIHAPPSALWAAAGAYAITGAAAKLVFGVSAHHVKPLLEAPSMPGESNYGLFRSARQAMSPVEEFMVLYNILLMLYNDEQVTVDRFIVSEEPEVPQTPHPLKCASWKPSTRGFGMNWPTDGLA